MARFVVLCPFGAAAWWVLQIDGIVAQRIAEVPERGCSPSHGRSPQPQRDGRRPTGGVLTMRADVDVEIVYSPDDGGWYLQRFPDGAVSADVYSSSAEAFAALASSSVAWEGGHPS